MEDGGSLSADTVEAGIEARPRVVLVNRCFVIDDQKRILLIRRSNNGQHSAGLWEPPGGKLDEGQDLSRAAEREVMEETGLLVEPTSRLMFTDSQILTSGKYKGLPYVVLFSINQVLGGKLRLSDEHDDSRWLGYGDVLDLELTHETRKALIILKDHLK